MAVSANAHPGWPRWIEQSIYGRRRGMFREFMAFGNLRCVGGELAVSAGIGSQAVPWPVGRDLAVALGAFVCSPTVAEAKQLFNAYESREDHVGFERLRFGGFQDSSELAVFVRPGLVVCQAGTERLAYRGDQAIAILESLSAAPGRLTPQVANFDQLFDELRAAGVLVPNVGDVRFGDLRRSRPVSADFGADRGTPIDRYYLSQFIRQIQDKVRGRVLEVGGVQSNRLSYRFARIESFTTLDLEPKVGVDVVGDLNDPCLFEPRRFDTIINFNVLEHVRTPWRSVENMAHWLDEGGHIATMVPSVQRVHLMPNDYWRMLPAALDAVHSCFRERELFVYGNALASVGALMGLAVEDFAPRDLDVLEADFPVATCLWGTK